MSNFTAYFLQSFHVILGLNIATIKKYNGVMKGQSGNALFLVLIGIVLLSALTFTVTRSNESGSGNIDDERANMVATQLIHFGVNLRQGVARLRGVNGCRIEQISFEKSPFDGTDSSYVNPNSPSDYRCHVFHANGGKVDNLVNTLQSEVGGTFLIGEGSALPGVGTSSTDLYMFVETGSLQSANICRAFNGILQNTTLDPTPTDDFAITPTPYQGSFAGSHTASGADYNGLKSFCYRDNSSNQIRFIQVLIER